jgi:LysM repeat protein
MKFKQGVPTYSIFSRRNADKLRIRTARGLVVCLLFFFIGMHPALAQQKASTHTVKEGETLFSIAQKYKISVDQIKKWNDLTSNVLDVGQTLRVSSTTTESDPASTPGEKAPPPPQQDTQETSSSSYYVVKSGDTLYEIAQKHDMSLQQLKSLNDLSSNNIRVGQRLLVRQPTPTPSVAQKTTGAAPQGQFLRYSVTSGESWQDLTEKFNMDSVELAHLNPDTDPSDLFNGKKITVLKPPSATYQNPYRIDAQLKLISTGTATKYADGRQGMTTSSGELYSPKSLTAAHSSISLGSIIYVVNQQNRRGVFVKVNDRTDSNGLKLSERAFNVLHLSGTNSRVQIYKRP